MGCCRRTTHRIEGVAKSVDVRCAFTLMSRLSLGERCDALSCPLGFLVSDRECKFCLRGESVMSNLQEVLRC